MDAAGCDFVGSRKLLKQEVAVFGVLQLKARLISSFSQAQLTMIRAAFAASLRRMFQPCRNS